MSITLTVFNQARGEAMLEGYSPKPALHVLDYAREPLTVLREIVRLRRGSDVALIGDTWVSSFMHMNALRPFRPSEINHIGGAEKFLPAAWKMGIMPDSPEVWSIPWEVAPRLVIYRRDLLEKAGVDEASAFSTPEHFEETLRRLQESGIQRPLGMWTSGMDLLFHAAAWLRERGEIMTPDLRRVAFDSPEAKAGLAAFFRLLRYASAEGPDVAGWLRMFSQARLGLCLSGPWMWRYGQRVLPAEELSRIGLACPPGVPFLGGDHIVIWEHTTRVEEALRLADHLASFQVVERCYANPAVFSTLPARRDVFEGPVFASDPQFANLRAIMDKARGFHAWRLSGTVQERLQQCLEAIARAVLADPAADIPRLVDEHVDPAAFRLNRALEG